MTNTPTDPTVELLVGDTWVDVTPDCRLESADSGGGFEITRGTPNEGGSAEPTQFNFTLNNGVSKVPSTLGQTGCYSPRNPLGPYYGLLGRNQPVRVGMGRRSDSFARTQTDGWGSVPSKIQADGDTVAPAIPWHLTGTGSLFDVTPGAATIGANAGVKLATFGTYADVEIRTKLKVATRDTEFGIVPRLKPTFMTPPVGVDPTFESGNVAGWVSNSGTVSLNSTVAHGGSKAVQVVVTGSPATCSLYPAISTTTMWGAGNLTINGQVRLRQWVRCTIATTIRSQMSFYDKNLAFTTGLVVDTVVAANTWTLLDFTGNVPEDSVWLRPGAIIQGSPPNGTVLILDDIEVYDQNNLCWYTANFVPSGADTVKFGKVANGLSRSSSAPLGQQLIVDTWYWMLVQVTGQRLRMKMWKDGDPEPVAWLLTWFDDYTVSDFPVGASGEVGVFAAGGSGTATFGSIEINQWRAYTEIAELPTRWDLARVDRWVPIQSRGMLRRLGQGRKALRSSTSLHLQSYAASSQGWWPLEEEGENAGNNVEGGSPGFQAGISYGEPDTTGAYALPGVSRYASLGQDTSYFIGNLKPHTAVGFESVLFFMRLPSAIASDSPFMYIYTSGTVRTWRFSFATANGLLIQGYDRSGNEIENVLTNLYPGGWPVGSWIGFYFRTYTSGGSVAWELLYHRPTFSGFFSISDTVASATLGTMSSIKLQASPAITTAGGVSLAQLMHLTIDLPFVTDDFLQAAAAYIGELSTDRFLRLATNAGIRANIAGSQTQATPMGPQEPSKLVELLEDCAAVEDGIILEERGAPELTLRTRDSMWNGIRHRLDIDLGHLSAPLEPNDDDQKTRNDVTVTRPDGGFARSIQIDGPLNVNPPEDDPEGVGVYDEVEAVKVAADDQLQSVADWRRSKGTQDDSRYPSMHADLSATAYQNSLSLTAEVLALDAGDNIELLNVEVSPDPSDQQIRSLTEKFDVFDYDLTWVTVPAEVYRVGVVSYNTRIATKAHFTSASFVAGSEQRLNSQQIGAGLPWVYPPDSEISFPFDIMVAGSRLRVISSGDVLNTNPNFTTDLTGWAATSGNATIFWDRWDPKRGVANARVKTAAAGNDGIATASGSYMVTIPAADYFIAAWIKTEVAATSLQLVVDWYQADGVTYITSGATSAITTVANVWTRITGTLTAPALGARARYRVQNIFAGSSRMWVNSPRLIPVFSYNSNPQILTVELAPVNGIAKSIPIGSPIRLVDPWRLAW